MEVEVGNRFCRYFFSTSDITKAPLLAPSQRASTPQPCRKLNQHSDECAAYAAVASSTPIVNQLGMVFFRPTTMDDEVRAPARATPHASPPAPAPGEAAGDATLDAGASLPPRLPPPPSSRCRTLLCSNERPVRISVVDSSVVLFLTSF